MAALVSHMFSPTGGIHDSYHVVGHVIHMSRCTILCVDWNDSVIKVRLWWFGAVLLKL